MKLRDLADFLTTFRTLRDASGYFQNDALCRVLIYVGLISLCALPARITAAEISTPNLKIQMIGIPESEAINGKIISAADACAKFSSFFLRQKGLFATGSFASVSCGQTNEDKKSVDPNLWNLIIRASKGTTRLEMHYGLNAQAPAEVVYELKSDYTAIELLVDAQVSSLIALYIHTALPFRVTGTPDEWKTGTKLIGIPPSGTSLKAPDELLIFSLVRTESGSWLPKIVGSAKIAKNDSSAVEWNIIFKNKDTLTAPAYFAQDARGRDQDLEALDLAIKDASGGLMGKIIGAARAAYIGFRYGVPLLQGAPLVSTSPLIGIFGEFRSGILNGLKVNYDFVPLSTSSIDSSVYTFKWTRFQLGYSFGRDLSIPFINWIDVTPRLGITNLLLTRSASEITGRRAYSFSMNSAPALGVELGLERRLDNALLRTWGFVNYSFGIIPGENLQRITALRAGIDYYRDLYKFQTMSLAGLGFAAVDKTKITRKSNGSPNETSVSEINYANTYIGGGLTLTW